MSVFGTDTPNLSTEDAMRDSLQNLLPPDQKANYMSLFSKFLLQKQQAQKYMSTLDSCTDPEPDIILHRDAVPPCPEDAALRRELLDKLVIVRLNGGLGSSMGCHSVPKCAIEVRNGLSFLDLSIRQIEYLNSLHGVDLPIIYLNSFKTHQITTKLIRRYRRHNLTIHTVLQNCFPRISKTTLMPIATVPFEAETSEEWYPPGHGDLYYSLWSSGVLDSLLHDGKEYAFISNIDNLCSTVDFDMLYHIYCNEVEFCVEATTPNRTDTEGGYFTVSPAEAKLKLVEISEITADKRDEFKRKHKYFNTNNIWLNLRSLKKLMDTIDIRDRIIVSERETDTGITVLQLETTVGSLVSKIRQPLIIAVPRKLRYVPVKTTADLLLIQSDIFSIKHGALILNGSRLETPLPIIKLGKEFSAIDDYQKRVPKKHPNILELEHLTIAGDVYIGSNVTLTGTVIIIAVDGSVIMIPDGSVLVDKVVTGNLRILDH